MRLVFVTFFIFIAIVIARYDKKYVKHCKTVGDDVREPGVISILTFLDPLWPYCDEQLEKLKDLEENLENLELPQTSFFIIIKSNNSDPNITDESLNSLKSLIPTNFTIIEDNNELQIWNKLNVTRNHVFVVNRCGIIRHQFIVRYGVPRLEPLQHAILKAEQRSCECNLRSVIHANADKLKNEEENSAYTMNGVQSLNVSYFIFLSLYGIFIFININ